jgi:hypothetical protein
LEHVSQLVFWGAAAAWKRTWERLTLIEYHQKLPSSWPSIVDFSAASVRPQTSAREDKASCRNIYFNINRLTTKALLGDILGLIGHHTKKRTIRKVTTTFRMICP